MPNEPSHYGGYGGTFAECVEKVGSWSDNPEGFCNWIHQQSQGGAPGSEERKDTPAAGVSFRCADCDALAPVEYVDGVARYASHTCAVDGSRGVHPCVGSQKPLASIGKLEGKADTARARVSRIDLYAAPDLAKPEVTQEGFLKVEGRISRAGIQTYYDADGKEFKEFRPPDEVFDDESLRSFRMVPVTNNHPMSLLDDASARAHTVGAVGENITKDGDFVRAPLTIYDRGAISSARNGRSQLSCGYSCELDYTPGVWQGQRYDAVQRKIRGNHVALVDMARAGPEARIRLDAQKNAMLAFDDLATNRETSKMAQIRIDGTAIDLTEGNVPVVQQMVDRSIAAAKKDGAEALAAEKTRADGAERKLKIVKKNVVSFIKRADAMKAKMVGCDACGGTGKMTADDGMEEKCDYCDGKGEFRLHEAVGQHGTENPESSEDGDDMELDVDELEVEQAEEGEAKSAHKDKKRADAHVARQRAFRKKVDSMVDARIAKREGLLDAARRVFGATWKADGKSSVEIKRAILGKLEPKADAAKLDGQLLEGEFRGAMRRLDAQPNAADRARAGTAQPSVPVTDAGDARTAARQKMMKANQDAWKRPAPAAK